MKEQDLIKVLEDFSKRVEYIREDIKKGEKGAHKHLKSLYEAKENLLMVIESNLGSILSVFQAIDVIDQAIMKENKSDEKLSDKELSKYEKD